jgi:predicted nicotinamide N-methyase
MTVAGYPTRAIRLGFGTIDIDLLTVRRLEDYVDTAALLRDADAPEPPYWAHLWTGSRHLAGLLATRIACGGRRAIDIGCGLGLVGVVAARRGARVIAIDSTHAALAFARANAARNACALYAVQADVAHPGLRGPYDLCLAADVTYDPRLQHAIGAFLAAHLSPAGEAWCVESVRTMDPGFRRACEAQGLCVSEYEDRAPDDGRDVWGRVTTVTRR